MFVPGRELNARFYREIVEPLAGPWPHAAALLGWGSDVLGYDTPRSTDHGWGPRVQLFVDDGDVAAVARAVEAGLPGTFAGWPVRFGRDAVEMRHWVDVSTLPAWLDGYLGVDATRDLTTTDWLVLPQQLILGVVRGAVYADPRGRLAAVRARLEWYPDDVWRWLLACGWNRIGQEEHFVGRTAQVGDELGSRLLAGRLVRDLMRLCFLQERVYCPYAKWFGTAFRDLHAYAALAPMLDAVLRADDHASREAALVAAYEFVAQRNNELGLTEPVDPTVRPFHDRPFQVLFAGRFAEACRAGITDPWLRELPPVGSVDQISDSTDVLERTSITRALAAVYRA